jgi:hypothetical protein
MARSLNDDMQEKFGYSPSSGRNGLRNNLRQALYQSDWLSDLDLAKHAESAGYGPVGRQSLITIVRKELKSMYADDPRLEAQPPEQAGSKFMLRYAEKASVCATCGQKLPE